MYQEVLPLMTLQAAMQNLLTRIVGDHNFGLSDLISPSSKRFRKFLSILANFYMFTDVEYGKVEKVRNDVENSVKAKKELAVKIEDYKNKINFYKSKAVEEAAEEDGLREEKAELEKKLDEMTKEHMRITAVKNKEKQVYEEEEMKTKVLEDELRRLENERDQIQAVVDAEAIMKRLDKELAEYAEELAIKEKNHVANRNRLEEVEKSTKECQSMFETVQQISSEKQTSKSIQNIVEEMVKNIEKLNLEGKETEKIKGEEEVRVKEMLETLNKMRSQWSWRRDGKQEELDQANQELAEAKLTCSEEQQKVMKMESQVRDLELEYGEEQDGITFDARRVRLQYNKIMEKIISFNERMAADVDKLTDSKNKLDRACSGL